MKFDLENRHPDFEFHINLSLVNLFLVDKMNYMFKK